MAINHKVYKVIKSFITMILVLLCFFFSSLPVSADVRIPNPTSDFFVNDFAGVLSDDVKSHINKKSQQYHASNGTQVVVAAIESLEGTSIEEYSLELARKWGIGSKKENNGILILLAVEDREIRVEVGNGLEGTITDSLSGRFIRAITPELKEDNFDDGIKKLYDLILQELEEPGIYEESGEGEEEPSILFIIIVILIMLLGGFFGPKGRRRHRGYYDGGSFYGGGSHGGGFSGGGGSFGGGGASGKF